MTWWWAKEASIFCLPISRLPGTDHLLLDASGCPYVPYKLLGLDGNREDLS